MGSVYCTQIIVRMNHATIVLLMTSPYLMSRFLYFHQLVHMMIFASSILLDASCVSSIHWPPSLNYFYMISISVTWLTFFLSHPWWRHVLAVLLSCASLLVWSSGKSYTWQSDAFVYVDIDCYTLLYIAMPHPVGTVGTEFHSRSLKSTPKVPILRWVNAIGAVLLACQMRLTKNFSLLSYSMEVVHKEHEI